MGKNAQRRRETAQATKMDKQSTDQLNLILLVAMLGRAGGKIDLSLAEIETATQFGFSVMRNKEGGIEIRLENKPEGDNHD